MQKLSRNKIVESSPDHFRCSQSVPMWLAVSLLLGIRIAFVSCARSDIDILASELLNRSCAAVPVLVLRQPELHVRLCCAAGADINETSFFEYYTSRLWWKHSATEASLSEAGCSHWLAVNHSTNTATIHSIATTNTTWAMGWDATSSRLLLFTDDQLHDSSDEPFVLPGGRSVSLPLQLFQPAGTVDGGSEQTTLSSSDTAYINEIVSNTAICAALSRAMADGNHTVVLQSDEGLEHTETSIAHWLDLCGLKATVIHTYAAHPWPVGSNSRKAAELNPCTVRYVTGLRPFCNMTHVQGHQCINTPLGQQLAVCIEDALTYTARYGACESTHSGVKECMVDTESWQRCHIQGEPMRSTIHYVSSLRFSETILTASQRKRALMGNPHRDLAGFRDLVTVLRAFANADCADLLSVHTINPADTVPVTASADQISLTRLLLNLLLVFNDDPAAPELFNAALSELESRLAEASTGALQTDLSQVLAVLDALMSVLGADFRRLERTCRASSQSYICAHAEAQQALAAQIAAHTKAVWTALSATEDVGRSPYLLDTLLPMLKSYLDLAVQRISAADDPTPGKALSEPMDVASAAAGAIVGAAAVRPLVRIFVDGDVHVLIFVRPEHTPLAQRLVAHWQRNGAQGTNFLFVRYVVIPIATPREGLTALQTKPSLRAVLRLVKEKVEQLVSVEDIVYVLVGVEALLSFPQPGRRTAAQMAEERQWCLAGTLRRGPHCDDDVSDGNDWQSWDRCSLCSPAPDSSAGSADDRGVPSASPRDCDFLAGVVPAISYGASGTYNLPTKIVFAALAPDSSSDPSVRGPVVSDYAFVGLGHTILHMINWVQRQAGYTLAGDRELSALLASYRSRYSSFVQIDCHQHAFHTAKGRQLLELLQTPLSATSEDATPVPGADSLADMARGLHTPVIGGLADTCDRVRYYPDMRAILTAYLGDSEDGLRYLRAALQYPNEIMGYLHLDSMPYAAALRYDEDNEQGGDGGGGPHCMVDIADVEVVLKYVTTELHETHKILAAALALMGVMDQLVRCFCAEQAVAVDEVTHFFVKIGLTVRRVTHMVDPVEFTLVAALLETFELHVAQRFGGSTAADSSGFTAGCAVSANDDCLGPVELSDLQLLYQAFTSAMMEQLLIAVRFALAGIHQEIGLLPDVVRSMASSLRPSNYNAVRQRRSDWQRERGHLQQRSVAAANRATSSIKDTTRHAAPRVHYVTYSSDDGPGLQNLLFSAALAGINIEVLGVGTAYLDYSSKTEALWSYLHHGTGSLSDRVPQGSAEKPCQMEGTGTCSQQGRGSKEVPDDDIVLFMDAYDVLVFPALADAARVLAEAPTPIVFCAERGIYPEFQGTYFYPRSVRTTRPGSEREATDEQHYAADGRPSSMASAAESQKFLNSGCILGRAGEMKRLMSYAKRHGRLYRDDQLAMVRYLFEHPDQVSLDSGNQLFLTNFKLTSDPDDTLLNYDLTLRVGKGSDAPSVGLLHCNNMRSGSSYEQIIAGLRKVHAQCYSGPDAPHLLRALRFKATGDTVAAVQMLQHPLVLRNCTSQGGANMARQLLLYHWAREG